MTEVPGHQISSRSDGGLLTHEEERPVLASPADGTDAERADVVAAARGDRGAWSRLYERNLGLVHGLLLLQVQRADAEDLAQEVFLKAMTRLQELREPEAFGPWLARVTRNEAAMLQRGRRRAELRLRTMAELAPRAEVGVGAGGAEGAEGVGRVDPESALAVIRGLPENYGEPLVLRLVEGLTGPQIAAALGMSHGAVRVSLSRGMAMLRAALKRGGAGGAGEARRS
jgi:RNA polymerase sigma-70 factor (ECF subfamily)